MSARSGRTILAIDMDGVMYDMIPRLRFYAIAAGYPVLQVAPEPRKWDFADQWGMHPNEWRDVFRYAVVEGDLWAVGDPFPGAVEAVQALYEDGYIIRIVTARTGFGVVEQSTKRTHSWLVDHDVPFESLHVTARKTDVDWHIIVDDHTANIEAAIRAGREGMLMGRKWNEHSYLPRWAWGSITDRLVLTFPQEANGRLHVGARRPVLRRPSSASSRYVGC